MLPLELTVSIASLKTSLEIWEPVWISLTATIDKPLTSPRCPIKEVRWKIAPTASRVSIKIAKFCIKED